MWTCKDDRSGRSKPSKMREEVFGLGVGEEVGAAFQHSQENDDRYCKGISQPCKSGLSHTAMEAVTHYDAPSLVHRFRRTDTLDTLWLSKGRRDSTQGKQYCHIGRTHLQVQDHIFSIGSNPYCQTRDKLPKLTGVSHLGMS